MTLIGTHDTVRAVTELAGVPLPHTKRSEGTSGLLPNNTPKQKEADDCGGDTVLFAGGAQPLLRRRNRPRGMRGPHEPQALPVGQPRQRNRGILQKIRQIRKNTAPDFIAHTLAKAEGGLLKIERPSLVLAANSSPRPAPIAPSYDLLSGKTVYEVAPGEAVICTRQ